jgi:hypothetical protein
LCFNECVGILKTMVREFGAGVHAAVLKMGSFVDSYVEISVLSRGHKDHKDVVNVPSARKYNAHMRRS